MGKVQVAKRRTVFIEGSAQEDINSPRLLPWTRSVAPTRRLCIDFESDQQTLKRKEVKPHG